MPPGVWPGTTAGPSLVALRWLRETFVAGRPAYLKFVLRSGSSTPLQVSLVVFSEDADCRHRQTVSLNGLAQEAQVALPFTPSQPGEQRLEPIVLLVEAPASTHPPTLYRVNRPVFVKVSRRELPRPERIVVDPFAVRPFLPEEQWEELPLVEAPELAVAGDFHPRAISVAAETTGPTRSRTRLKLTAQTPAGRHIWYLFADQSLTFGRQGTVPGETASRVVLRLLPDTPANQQASRRISRTHFRCVVRENRAVLQSLGSGGLTVDGKDVPAGAEAVLAEQGEIEVAGVLRLRYRLLRLEDVLPRSQQEIFKLLQRRPAIRLEAVLFRRTGQDADTGYILLFGRLPLGTGGVIEHPEHPVAAWLRAGAASTPAAVVPGWQMDLVQAVYVNGRVCPPGQRLPVEAGTSFSVGGTCFRLEEFSESELKGPGAPTPRPASAPSSGSPLASPLSPVHPAQKAPHPPAPVRAKMEVGHRQIFQQLDRWMEQALDLGVIRHRLTEPIILCESAEEFYKPLFESEPLSESQFRDLLEKELQQAREGVRQGGGVFGVFLPGRGCLLNGWLIRQLSVDAAGPAAEPETPHRALDLLLSTAAHEKWGHGFLSALTALGAEVRNLHLDRLRYARRFPQLRTNTPEGVLLLHKWQIVFDATRFAEEGWATWVEKRLFPECPLAAELTPPQPPGPDSAILEGLAALPGEDGVMLRGAWAELLDPAVPPDRASQAMKILDEREPVYAPLVEAQFGQPPPYVLGLRLCSLIEQRFGRQNLPLALLLAGNVTYQLAQLPVTDLAHVVASADHLNVNQRLAALAHLPIPDNPRLSRSDFLQASHDHLGFARPAVLDES